MASTDELWYTFHVINSGVFPLELQKRLKLLEESRRERGLDD